MTIETEEDYIAKATQPCSSSFLHDFSIVRSIVEGAAILAAKEQPYDSALRIGDAMAAAQLAIDIEDIRRASWGDASSKFRAERGTILLRGLDEMRRWETALSHAYFRNKKIFDLRK